MNNGFGDMQCAGCDFCSAGSRIEVNIETIAAHYGIHVGTGLDKT
jgi:hypothetical protein